ncbi:hypothetical protein AI3013V2_0562 [Enterobacter cloacae]|nr:hypothetical protein AI3013V2_0562 [Enterobacter cloacae]CAH5570442.1 hypothetical protein AI3013V2_0562 [Enterobacter cloacae]VAE76322.1 Uncharacterised protein [Enterobacter hormaechei]VAL21042.1 Uncharacterised protein [Enterobacter hormaechei]
MRAITGKRSDVVRFAGWRLRLTRPTDCGFRRVAAAPYPAYGLCNLPGGGYALPGLRIVGFAGWRLRLTRPTDCGFCRVTAAPYPAYGMCVSPGGGYALPGLRIVQFAGWRLRLTRPTDCAICRVAASDLACGIGFCRPGKRSATGRFYRGRRMAQREPYAKPCAVSSSRFWRISGVSVVIISNPNRL